MLIFHYHPDTGVLLAGGVADGDPLEEGRWLIPAHATAVEPPAFDTATHVAVFNGEAWTIEALPAPPPPPAPPTVAEIAAQLAPELRARRDRAMSILDGLQADALTDGDTATAQSIKAAKQACRDLPALDVSAATDEDGVRVLYLAEWQRITAMVPTPARVAFAAVPA